MMLKPSDFIINNFHDIAQGDNALCVGVRPYKEYKDGIAGEIAGFTYDLVLASRKFEHINLKVPGAALLSPDLFTATNTAVKIEQIQDFSARWYKSATMSDYALSCKASGFTIAREGKA